MIFFINSVSSTGIGKKIVFEPVEDIFEAVGKAGLRDSAQRWQTIQVPVLRTILRKELLLHGTFITGRFPCLQMLCPIPLFCAHVTWRLADSYYGGREARRWSSARPRCWA